MRAFAVWLCLLALASAALAQECEPVDWLVVDLPQGGDFLEIALEVAYPGSDLDRSGGTFTSADGVVVPYGGQTDVAPLDRLANASIGDQFYYVYPLEFDLEPRKAAWHDPGRLRNDALFRALWFDSKSEARASLVKVRYRGQTRSASFQATSKHCVHAQLQAALVEIAGMGAEMDRFLANAGGSFNWRKISGTERLSAHSFGIAVDFSTKLGGYWRWSGAKPGQVGAYDNRFPAELVEAMERYGFIWGGKWHHFDGMHFEYRPELIVMSRLVGG
ncbi:MAG: M15 family metallopeptidase [Rhodobacteraceae bacterium]|nr:M15 family metallopeptidase [Paracoccaceae bacterium]